MATKSILKTIHIKKPENARRLASALENASGKAAQTARLDRIVSDASQEEICRMFGKANGIWI